MAGRGRRIGEESSLLVDINHSSAATVEIGTEDSRRNPALVIYLALLLLSGTYHVVMVVMMMMMVMVMVMVVVMVVMVVLVMVMVMVMVVPLEHVLQLSVTAQAWATHSSTKK
jgi:hypothetical protein